MRVIAGIITVAKRLSYKHTPQHNISVIAHAGVNEQASTLVIVTVSDDNDNSPVFNRLIYEGSVQENMPIGNRNIYIFKQSSLFQEL